MCVKFLNFVERITKRIVTVAGIVMAITVSTTSPLSAQKLYVWCPKDPMVNPRTGFLKNDTIDLVSFDGRLLTSNSKIECSSQNIIAQLESFIKQTYPSAVLNVLASDKYYEDPQLNRVTIKITISAYHAAFGADVKIGIGSSGGSFSYLVFPEGKWNGVTAFSIKIYDYRNGKQEKKVKDIAKIGSKSNLLGYATAKSILNQTYIEANQEMLMFIDEALMK